MTSNDIFRICADVESPLMSGAELARTDNGDCLVRLGLVNKCGIPSEAPCPSCHGERTGRIGGAIQNGQTHLFHCPCCGRMKIQTAMLENWRLDYDALVRAVSRKLGCVTMREELRGHLWNLGFSLAGFSKPVWIVRKYCSEMRGEIDRRLPHDPRAVLFSMGQTPQTGVGRITPDRIIPLFELIEIGEDVIVHPGVNDYLKPLKLEVEEAPNRLVVNGNYWLVRFDGGETLSVKHQKGFIYLAALIEHANKDVSVLDLTGSLVEKEGASLLSGTSDVIDIDALREYRRRIDVIQNRLADGEYSSGAEKMELLEEQERIRKEVRNSVTASGRLRKRNDKLDHPRQAVYRAIQRALDTLKEAGAEEMAEHLRKNIRTGNQLRYMPSGNLDWEVYGF